MDKAEPFFLKGTMISTLIKPDGTVLTYRRDNLITNAGFDFIADAIGKSSGRPSAMGYIAVGTGATAAAAANTALGTELARKAAAYSHVAGTKVFALEATFNAGEATGAITESGVLNAASGGDLLDRVVFSVINKGSDDVLKQVFQFTMS